MSDSVTCFTGMPSGLMPVSSSHVEEESWVVVVGGKKFILSRHIISGYDEDKVFEDLHVWRSLRRGEVVVRDGETGEVLARLTGMHKFEYNAPMSTLPTGHITAQFIEKVNGENAKFSAFKDTDGAKYWLISSKNVALIVRKDHLEADLSTYVEQKFNTAIRIARIFVNELARIGAESANALFDVLAQNCWTANAEVIFADTEHFVKYDEAEVLRYFGITYFGYYLPPWDTMTSATAGASSGGCAAAAATATDSCVPAGVPINDSLCMDPIRAMTIFAGFGLRTATVKSVCDYKSGGYDEMVNNIHRETNSEGAVVYLRDDSDRIVGVFKLKALNYVVLRIIREAALNSATPEKAWSKVLSELGMDDDTITTGAKKGTKKGAKMESKKITEEQKALIGEWLGTELPFYKDFISYLHNVARLLPAAKKTEKWAVSSKWVTLTEAFKMHVAAGAACATAGGSPASLVAASTTVATIGGGSGTGSGLSSEVSGAAGAISGMGAAAATVVVATSPSSGCAAAAAAVVHVEKKLIVFAGLQGSGKSTVARSLTGVINMIPEFKAAYVNADECCKSQVVDMGKRHAAFVGQMNKVMADPTVTHVIVDRVHARQDMLKDFKKWPISALVAFVHPGGDDEMKRVCTERFVSRGACHRTIPSAGSKAVAVEKFVQWLEESSKTYSTVAAKANLTIDMTLPTQAALDMVCHHLGLGGLPAEMLEEAICESRAYETLLASGEAHLFASLAITGGNEALTASIPADALVGKVLKPTRHITLAYFGNGIDHSVVVKHDRLRREGAHKAVKVVELVYDEKCVTAVTHDNYHITLALAPGTEAVYSNTLLTLTTANRVSVDIDLDTMYCFNGLLA